MSFKDGDRVVVKGYVPSLPNLECKGIVFYSSPCNDIFQVMLDSGYAVYATVEMLSTPSSTAPVSLANYPHKCPKCNGPAYIGFNSIDCSKGCK